MRNEICTFDLRSLVLCASLAAGAAMAGDATPLAQYRDVQTETYRNDEPDFSLSYPYRYRGVAAPGPGQVFTASDATRVPSIGVTLVPRPEGLTLQASVREAAKRLSPTAEVTEERDVDLDGTPARRAMVAWSMPIGFGLELRTLLVSAYRDGHWIVVSATDGVTAGPLLPELEASATSLRFQ